MYKQDTNKLKRAFENVISFLGAPKLVVADRGRMYDSAALADWITEVGSSLYLIILERYQSNGQVETNFGREKSSNILWKL